jgi:hypothetical protein
MRRMLMLAAVLLVSAACFADSITFTALLTGPNEFPSNASPGTGFATVTYDSLTHLLGVDVSFSGLTAGTTASHIHCCTLPTAGVATTIPTFAGFPLGVTSGTYVNTLDLTFASSFNPAFITANGGTVNSAEAALAAGLFAGVAYLNIHTTNFPAGEIRGFLTPVPEPSTLTLLGSSLVSLWAMRRRRRRTR